MNISPDAQYIAIFFLLSFIMTLVALPRATRIIRSSGMVVRDYYKAGQVCVPTNGGLLITLVVLVMLSASIISICNSTTNLIIVYIAAMYATFGILEDYLQIRNRWLKIVFPYFLSYPIALIIQPQAMETIGLFFNMTPAVITCFYYIIAPMYVMVVANMVNMHSGFNGLQSGLSSIVFFFLLVKSFMVGRIENLIIFAAFFGANLAFWTRNRYPSSIFEGNIGAMLIGAAMGIFIVFQGFLISGIVMLSPHIINFLMYFYWRVRRKICHIQGTPTGEYGSFKFGHLRGDGTISVPNKLTLKWLPPYYYPMTERAAVRIMYALTITTCAIALYVPY